MDHLLPDGPTTSWDRHLAWTDYIIISPDGFSLSIKPLSLSPISGPTLFLDLPNISGPNLEPTFLLPRGCQDIQGLCRKSIVLTSRLAWRATCHTRCDCLRLTVNSCALGCASRD